MGSELSEEGKENATSVGRGSQPASNRVARQFASIFIDESGSKNSKGGFFVVGFIKTRRPAVLSRKVRALRQKYHYYDEIKFSSINYEKIQFYFDLVETIAAEDVRVGGSVYNAVSGFPAKQKTWECQAQMAKRLVIGNVNKGEMVNVFLDLVQTPTGKTVAEMVRNQINEYFGKRIVMEAYDIDSRTMELVQLADIIAGSVAYLRKNPQSPKAGKRSSPKRKVAERFRRALELESFEDTRQGKVNILTMGTQPRQEMLPIPRLTQV